MKKLLITLLVVVFTLSAATMAFAAEKPNPYSDVPANHWAYQAVTDLYKSGVMEGWADKFHGQSTLTRYEIAAITARALAKADKADAATKAQIEKLATEFKSELDSLGVRVEALEKKAGNVKIDGNVRARYIFQKQEIPDWAKHGIQEVNWHFLDKDYAYKGNSTFQELRTRVQATGQIDDNWKYVARFEGTENFKKSGADSSTTFSAGYLEGKLSDKWTATVGRFDYIPASGLVFDDTVDGAKLTYTEGPWQANLMYARTVDAYGLKNVAGLVNNYAGTNIDINPTQAALEVRYELDKNLSLAAAYQEFAIKAENVPSFPYKDELDQKFRSTELSFVYKLNDDWKLNGAYAKTALPSSKVWGPLESFTGVKKSDLDSAYLFGVSYKGADPKVKDSWGVYANYKNIEPLAVYSSTYESANIKVGVTDGIAIPTGFKGYEVGFDYAPFQNSKLKLYYIDGKSTLPDVGDDITQKFYCTQLEVFF